MAEYRYEEEIIDPYYKIFLDHLRPDGKSYVLQINKEEKDKMKKYEPSPYNTTTSHNNKDKKKKNKSNSNKKTLGSDWANLLLSCHSIDPYYRIYLEKLRLSNGSVPNFNNCLEEEQEPKEDRHRQISASSVFAYGDEHGDGSFGKRLRKCLNKPFCRREYDELMAMATQRKPVSQQRHLRQRSVSYATQKMGLSLLDSHSELIKQIERADRREGLTLLRGFFFWLNNLSHKGSFKPWKETSPCGLNSCAVID